MPDSTPEPAGDEYAGSDMEQFFKLAEQFGLGELLPEWEISVIEYDDPDTWEHYHPRAATEEAAREIALREAKRRSSPFDHPQVYEVLIGPYAPNHAGVVEEVLSNDR